MAERRAAAWWVARAAFKPPGTCTARRRWRSSTETPINKSAGLPRKTRFVFGRRRCSNWRPCRCGHAASHKGTRLHAVRCSCRGFGSRPCSGVTNSELHCALAAAQCIVIGPVCVCGWVCVCGSVTTIIRNCVHRSSPNWVCR